MVTKTNLHLKLSIKDESFDLEQIGRYTLCFRIDADEIAVAVFDGRNDACKLLEIYSPSLRIDNFEEMQEIFENVISNHNVLSARYWQRVVCVLNNKSFAFIPEHFFDVKLAQDYLELSVPFHTDQQYIQYTQHPVGNFVCVFAAPKIYADWIADRFPNSVINFVHYNAAFSEALLSHQTNKPDELHVLVRNKRITIANFDGVSLRFMNTYDFLTQEDFVYYVIMVAEELKLSTYKTNVILYGDIREDGEGLNLLKRYVASVAFGKQPKGISFSYRFDEIPEHWYLALFGAYQVKN